MLHCPAANPHPQTTHADTTNNQHLGPLSSYDNGKACLWGNNKFQSHLAKSQVRAVTSQPCAAGCSLVASWEHGRWVATPPSCCCHLPPVPSTSGSPLCLQLPARLCSAAVQPATILAGAGWCFGKLFLNRLVSVLAKDRGREEYIISSDLALQRACCFGSASQK